jgi:hypothetical protein
MYVRMYGFESSTNIFEMALATVHDERAALKLVAFAASPCPGHWAKREFVVKRAKRLFLVVFGLAIGRVLPRRLSLCAENSSGKLMLLVRRDDAEPA